MIPPNPSEFVKMISSARFGGQNYWSSAAQGFKGTFRVINNIWPKFQQNLDMFDDDEPIGFSYIEQTFIGYLLHYVHFFPKLRRYLKTINPSDFKQVKEISSYLFLEKESNAYGFLIFPLPMFSSTEAETFLEGSNLWNEEGVPWKIKPFPTWEPNHLFTTEPLEYIAPFVFYFGTLEELIEVLPQREKLDVSGHFRHLKSGKTVPVRSHKKRKPIKAKAVKDDIINKIVYCVYDKENDLRYIGEGEPDRYLHVNSGVSHNKKINEHFFIHGEMRVEILKEGLSKVEALAFEKMLLNQSREKGLWNKKDYEPFEDSLKGFTDEEVHS